MPPAGNTPWSIGSPTDEEQLYLELLNRSRANPPAESVILANTTDPDVLVAYTYFGVDLALMQSQFSIIPATPPLAMNAQLMSAARVHSQDMYANQFQGHSGTDGSTPGTRITAQGYNWSTYGENVYAYAESPFHGYAGFEVDWGTGTGGMQTPPGHRNNDHNSGFREVGMGIVNGVNGSVGPQLITQDFGTRQGATPLITGVVYYDLNGNGFYDVGEGIGGVTVEVPGSVYFAITANSGGYAVPVTTNGNYAVNFSATGLSASRTAVVSSLANVKMDYVPTYSAPVLSGPSLAGLSNNTPYTFTSVGGATSYDWESTRYAAYATVEGAESGLANLIVVSSAGYSVVINDLVASGNAAFHLAHPSPATDQFLTLNAVLQLHTNSQLSFSKRLGWASPVQVARAQISTNGGIAWTDVWTQPGNNSNGDSAYSTVTVNLGAYAGAPAQVRFVYDFTGGSYYYQTDSTVGLCLDNIAISNAQQAQSSVTNSIPSGNTFVFYPTSLGDYQLRVRARLPGRILPWGPTTRVTVSSQAPMTLQFAGKPTRTGNQFQAVFNVSNYRAGTPFLLLQSLDLGASWTTNTVATVQTLVSNSQFRVTTTNAATRAFYRIRAN